jgi:hypothetical protein
MLQCQGRPWNSQVDFHDGAGIVNDGSFDIHAEDPNTGVFTGSHTPAGGTAVPIKAGVCAEADPHIKITREVRQDRTLTKYEYRGHFVTEAARCDPRTFRLCIEGTVKRTITVNALKASNDDGDWTAQLPVTLLDGAQARRKAASKAKSKSKSKPKAKAKTKR